jgi:hypothetical protein
MVKESGYSKLKDRTLEPAAQSKFQPENKARGGQQGKQLINGAEDSPLQGVLLSKGYDPPMVEKPSPKIDSRKKEVTQSSRGDDPVAPQLPVHRGREYLSASGGGTSGYRFMAEIMICLRLAWNQ